MCIYIYTPHMRVKSELPRHNRATAPASHPSRIRASYPRPFPLKKRSLPKPSNHQSPREFDKLILSNFPQLPKLLKDRRFRRILQKKAEKPFTSASAIPGRTEKLEDRLEARPPKHPQDSPTISSNLPTRVFEQQVRMGDPQQVRPYLG